MTEKDSIIRELREIAASINTIADRLERSFPENTESPVEPEKNPEPVLSLQEVRAVLAEKSRQGATSQIRALLQKYGASKLSEVQPEYYRDLIKDAEGLGNG